MFERESSLDNIFTYRTSTKKKKSFFKAGFICVITYGLLNIGSYLKTESYEQGYLVSNHEHTTSIKPMSVPISMVMESSDIEHSHHSIYQEHNDPTQWLNYVNGLFEKPTALDNWLALVSVSDIQIKEVDLPESLKHEYLQKAIQYGTTGYDAQVNAIHALSFNCLGIDWLCQKNEHKFKEQRIKKLQWYKVRINEELYNFNHPVEFSQYNKLPYDVRQNSPSPYLVAYPNGLKINK